MSRESQRQKLLERYQPGQQQLFDEHGVPAEPGVINAIERKRYEHTGVRLTEDEGKALALVDLLVKKWGVAKIAAKLHISKATVRAARRLLADQGKLDPYKKRVVEAMQDGVEAAIGSWRDAVEGGHIHPAQLPIQIGIIVDKIAAAQGEPTSILGLAGVAAARSDRLTPDKINAAFVDILATVETPLEADSSGNSAKPQQIEGETAMDASLDASRAVGAGPDGPPPSPTGPSQPPEGGGGVLPVGRRRGPIQTVEKFYYPKRDLCHELGNILRPKKRLRRSPRCRWISLCMRCQKTRTL